jgi:hypothetical protein
MVGILSTENWTWKSNVHVHIQASLSVKNHKALANIWSGLA